MPIRKPRNIALLLACLALLSGPAALAQGDARWYRVELLVFSNEGTVTGERWAATPALAYPGSARFLVEPGRVAENLAEHGGESVVDEFGRQIITLPPEEEEDAQAAPEPTPQPVPGQAEVADAAMPGAGDPGQPPATAPLLPTPFVALPASQLEFRGKAAYMQRTGRYRTLFHRGWVQPVGGESSELPIVLDRSGDMQQWPRLQGSIKLYLSRYLHIETNLWLNTQGDYLPGSWRMPAPPLGPPSLVIEEPPPTELELAEELAAELAEEPAPAAAGTESADVTWIPGEATADTDEVLPPDPQELAGPVYPWRHAVLLQQKRRMRSTEVHYLDHPLFGLVVQLTPLEAEELEQMALAEAEAAAAEAAGQAP